MDEPLGALDKQLREHMQYEIIHIYEQLLSVDAPNRFDGQFSNSFILTTTSDAGWP